MAWLTYRVEHLHMEGKKVGEMLGTEEVAACDKMVSLWQDILLRIYLIQHLLITYATEIPYALKEKMKENSSRVRNIRHSKTWLRDTVMMKSYTNITGGKWFDMKELTESKCVLRFWTKRYEITTKVFISPFNRQRSLHAAVPFTGLKRQLGKGSCFPCGWTPKNT